MLSHFHGSVLPTLSDRHVIDTCNQAGAMCS